MSNLERPEQVNVAVREFCRAHPPRATDRCRTANPGDPLPGIGAGRMVKVRLRRGTIRGRMATRPHWPTPRVGCSWSLQTMHAVGLFADTQAQTGAPKSLRSLAGVSVASLLEEVLQGGFGLLAVSFEHSRQDRRGQPG